MSKLISVSSLAVLIAVVGSSSVYAASPAAIKVGVFNVTPTLAVDVKHDDNIFTSATGEETSAITVLKPNVTAEAKLGHTDLVLGYEHAAGIFANSGGTGDDDFNDNNLFGDVVWELNSKNELAFGAAFNQGHEDRGSEGSGAVPTPDEFDETLLDAKYTYGSESSKGRIELDVNSLDREFTNNRTSTTDNDREDLDVGATFFLKVANKTRVLFEIRNVDVDFDDPSVTRDSDTDKYNVGLNWDATAKTSGTVKVGQIKKDFDDSATTDVTLDSWEAAVDWAPKSYSVVSFNTSRSAKESSSQGSFIDSKLYSVNWQHEWSNRLKSSLSASLDEESYEGTTREDETNTYGVRFDYEMRRWIDIGFSLNYTDVESTDAASAYDRTQVGLHLVMGL
jgi:hypothetical protein